MEIGSSSSLPRDISILITRYSGSKEGEERGSGYYAYVLSKEKFGRKNAGVYRAIAKIDLGLMGIPVGELEEALSAGREKYGILAESLTGKHSVVNVGRAGSYWKRRA